MFDGIECEWPLFYELLLLDALITNDLGGVAMYSKLLERVVPTGEDKLQRVPELYLVPDDKVGVVRNYPNFEETQRLLPWVGGWSD